jgi:hypothetical protein
LLSSVSARKSAAENLAMSYPGIRLLLALMVALAGAPLFTRAHPAPDDFGSAPALEMHGIVFLHLRLHPGTVELLELNITPGRLKPGAEHAGERILLQVESQSGSVLWQGTVEDPRLQVLEGAEDAHGKRARKVVERAAPEIMVRVPFFAEGQMVRVSRVSPGKGAPAHHKLLGTFRVSQ